MKLNCIIDTCSCISLSNIEMRQKRILDFLENRANLNFSKEVNKELRDHKDKNLPNYILNSSRMVTTKKYGISEYERRMLGTTLLSRKKSGDKGEINNFLLSVDLVHHIKRSNIIYITDDKKALNGFIYEWVSAFPSITIWTSYDVILYLYSENIIPSKDVAKELIQDIISFNAPAPSERSDKTNRENTSLKVKYNECIEKISKILK